MALITNAIKGTLDLLPAESYKTQYVEAAVREIAENFGFYEMRTPVFEHTELFQRSVGETTDVVQKEMYTFSDKGGRSITLRPEGTAGAARAFLENGLFNAPLPQKIYYLTSCYRYEKPQAGRLREFHQFGVEAFGAGAPAQDAEIIALAHTVFRYLGVKNLTLEINSIGCPACRQGFQKALKAYFEGYKDKLCDTCLSRLDRNPMRILDCKSPVCSEIAKGAPKILDYLCDDCRTHFDAVQSYLKSMQIDFTVNPEIVRGLIITPARCLNLCRTKSAPRARSAAAAAMTGFWKNSAASRCPPAGSAWGLNACCSLWKRRKRRSPNRNAATFISLRWAKTRPAKPRALRRNYAKKASRRSLTPSGVL